MSGYKIKEFPPILASCKHCKVFNQQKNGGTCVGSVLLRNDVLKCQWLRPRIGVVRV